MSARRQRSIPGLLTEPLPASKRSSTQAPHGRTPPIEPINKNHVSKKTLTIIGAAAGAAALTPGAVSLASAEDQPAPVAADSSQSAPQGPGTGETPLNGIEAEQFTVAALEAVADTTIIRVETDSEGVLEAHVQEADGTEVEIAMDADFAITEVHAMHGRGGHDHGASDTGQSPDSA